MSDLTPWEKASALARAELRLERFKSAGIPALIESVTGYVQERQVLVENDPQAQALLDDARRAALAESLNEALLEHTTLGRLRLKLLLLVGNLAPVDFQLPALGELVREKPFDELWQRFMAGLENKNQFEAISALLEIVDNIVEEQSSARDH